MFKTLQVATQSKLQARRSFLLRWIGGIFLAALEFQAIYTVLLEVE